MDLAAEWGLLLRKEAAGYAQVALANIRREFPSGIYQDMRTRGILSVPDAHQLDEVAVEITRCDAALRK